MTTPALSRLWQRTLNAVNPLPTVRRNSPRPSRPPADRQSRQLASLLNLHPAEITRQPALDAAPSYAARLPGEGFSLNLVFSADLLHLYLLGIEIGPEGRYEAAAVVELLQTHGIQHLDHEALEQATLEASQHGGRVIWASIARGQAAQLGSDEQLDYGFDMAAAQPHFAALEADLTQRTASPPKGFTAVWAIPGQVLVRRSPAGKGQHGQDLFGRPIQVTDGRETALRPGTGVEQAEQIFRATAHGYVCLRGSELSVRSPLVVDADELLAQFCYIPLLPGDRPDAAQLRDIAKRASLTYGLVDDHIEVIAALFTSRAAQPRCLDLARGCPPQHGRDARLELHVDCQPKPGRLLPDGRFDFRETHFGLNVKSGDLLATLQPATSGTDGHSVRGQVLAARDGQDCTLTAGANVQMSETADGLRFEASLDGRIRRQGDQLNVFETLSIDGDVDYASGNIDFPGDVFINGSLLAEFNVRAQGSVAVRQQVENGASIEAGGDIMVGGGIVGAQTQIHCNGRLQSRFIHSATVRCEGDIEIGSYLIKGEVCCGGRILVRPQGGPKGGLVAGGHIIAAEGLEARFAGSPNGMPTRLVLGVDPAVEEALAACLATLETCRQHREQCRRLLGLSDIDLPGLKRLLLQATPSRRRQLAACIRQWHQLGRQIETLCAQHSALLEKRIRPRARLAIGGILYPGVQLRLGEHSAHVDAQMPATELTRDNWTETLLLQSAA